MHLVLYFRYQDLLFCPRGILSTLSSANFWAYALNSPRPPRDRFGTFFYVSLVLHLRYQDFLFCPRGVLSSSILCTLFFSHLPVLSRCIVSGHGPPTGTDLRTQDDLRWFIRIQLSLFLDLVCRPISMAADQSLVRARWRAGSGQAT